MGRNLHIAGRTLPRIGGAIFDPRHYRALLNSFRAYEHPVSGFTRYLTGYGAYPCRFTVRTRLGSVAPMLYSHHDMLTINEVFYRMDYRYREPKIVVDFGANIGISALFFLTRHTQTYCYLFEPLPQNAERLQENLQPFTGRFSFEPVAVGLCNGDVSFRLRANRPLWRHRQGYRRRHAGTLPCS